MANKLMEMKQNNGYDIWTEDRKKLRGQEVITEITIFFRPAFIPVEKKRKKFKSSYETHDHDFSIVQMLQHIPSLNFCCPVGVHILEFKLLR